MNSENLQKVIEGCLLGDGHIGIGKRCVNGFFSYRSSSKMHTQYVFNYFKEYCNYDEIKRSETYDKRTNKTYVSYYFRTKNDKIFTEQHKRFYKNKIKIIPKDIVLTKINLLFWYIGDGSISQDHIRIHTDSFTEKEVEFLCEKLIDFKATKLKKSYDNVNKIYKYIIYIPRFYSKSFFEYIGKCPIKDYKHRWEISEYKNKNIEKNGMSNYSHLYDKIIEEYDINKHSISELSKKYKVPIKCITNHFDKNGIIWKSKCTKAILQYDLNDNFIKLWDSGQEIKNELNYSKSAISQCCTNKRKTYKKFKWKFK